MAKTTIKKSKKTRQIIPHGQAHINATFNNTIVSITDEKGSVLTWSSGGSAGFKGAREATPYAAQVVAEQAISKAKTLHSIESVDVYVKGIGIGREQAIRGLISGGVDLKAIFDITPVPHNGCRKKKVRKL
ncbi:30S ribosomal protein S11 [Candidatus Gracilibacteria bacterium]|nr:30S ribosomal protein S11 [Candidatus Gracilibacteria bacterium]NVP18088.1 30S ribosomal protein S11 [Candidatus Gracilibacteria bacterium]